MAPSVNHDLLVAVLRRMGFAPRLCNLISHYLQGRQTRFRWCNRVSNPVDCAVGVGQGACTSPIFSAISIVPALYHITRLIPQRSIDIRSSFFVFVDDGALAVSSDSMKTNLFILSQQYPHIAAAFESIGILLEIDKLEIAHFVPRGFNGPYLPITISHNSQTVTKVPDKSAWRYLGFFLDPHLRFDYHVKYYSSKAMSTVRGYPMLGNSNRGLIPMQKRLLYVSCILPIMSYGFRLWYNPTHPPQRHLRLFKLTQSAAARWILGAFRTSPIGGMEILAGLLPIPIQLKRLYQQTIVRFSSLPPSHILKYAGEPHRSHNPLYTTGYFNSKRYSHPRTVLQRTLGHSPEVFEPISHSLPHLQPGHRLIDRFPDRFLLHTDAPSKKSKEFGGWLEAKRAFITSIATSSSTYYGFTDGSAKLNRDSGTAAAAYRVYRGRDLFKTLALNFDKAVAVDAELIALSGCVSILTKHASGVVHIFSDGKSAIQLLPNASVHTAHSFSVTAQSRIIEWLERDPSNVMHVHWIPGHEGIPQNEAVDDDAREGLRLTPIPLTTIAWSKQHAKHSATHAWSEQCRNPAYRGHNFLYGRKLPRPSTRRGGPFLRRFKENDITARAARAILNHAPTGEFRTRFFPDEPTSCNDCQVYQTRAHILNKCTRYVRKQRNFLEFLKNSSNPGEALFTFLDSNPSAFTFDDAPT